MMMSLASQKDEVLVIGRQIFNMVFISHMRDIQKRSAGLASDEGPWPPVTIVNPQIDGSVPKKNFKTAIIEVRENRLAEDCLRCEYVRAKYPLCQIVIVLESDDYQLQATRMLSISSGVHYCGGLGEAIEHVWKRSTQSIM